MEVSRSNYVDQSSATRKVFMKKQLFYLFLAIAFALSIIGGGIYFAIWVHQKPKTIPLFPPMNYPKKPVIQ